MESHCIFPCIKVKYWWVFIHGIGRFGKGNAMCNVKSESTLKGLNLISVA